MARKKKLSVTKVVGILVLGMAVYLKYDWGLAAGVCLIITKSIKPILLAYKGIDDDAHK